MKCPQTVAKEFELVFSNANLEMIAKYGCCAFVLLWVLGIEPDDIEAIKTVQRMREHKVIGLDCTVNWSKSIEYLTGRKLKSIEFKEIKSISNIEERTPVRYNFNGISHWVGVEKGKVAFNPLVRSITVERGLPTQARIIKIFGVEK